MVRIILSLFVVFFPHTLRAQDILQAKQGVVRIRAQAEGQPPRTGTGFVVLLTKQRAYIVTAAHVIKGDPHPQVTFFSQPDSALNAQVLGAESALGDESDEETGLAVLLVEGHIPSGTRMLDLDTNAEVGGGKAITLIGFPRLLSTPWAVTKGIVTGLKRDLIIIQLPVEEGNSGGPVLMKETVVGVVVESQGQFGHAVSIKKVQSAVTSWVPREKEKEIISRDGAPMMLIPAGKFLMGSDDGPNDERPARPVYLDAFYIDKHEVTVSQYRKFMQRTGHSQPEYFKAGYFRKIQLSDDLDGNRPVVLVSWRDAEAYCRWAGKRLPTEAQWEKSARGPKGRKYPWGDDIVSAGTVNWGRTYSDDWLREGLEPVTRFKKDQSIYGVFDLGGNVAEWIADKYSPSAYKDLPDRNPTNPMTKTAVAPMSRGSSWSAREDLHYSAKRYPHASTTAAIDRVFLDIGFRCARNAD
jgi:formylglycine-generating enzyme required for sulfatase activity